MGWKRLPLPHIGAFEACHQQAATIWRTSNANWRIRQLTFTFVPFADAYFMWCSYMFMVIFMVNNYLCKSCLFNLIIWLRSVDRISSTFHCHYLVTQRGLNHGQTLHLAKAFPRCLNWLDSGRWIRPLSRQRQPATGPWACQQPLEPWRSPMQSTRSVSRCCSQPNSVVVSLFCSSCRCPIDAILDYIYIDINVNYIQHLSKTLFFWIQKFILILFSQPFLLKNSATKHMSLSRHRWL